MKKKFLALREKLTSNQAKCISIVGAIVVFIIMVIISALMRSEFLMIGGLIVAFILSVGIVMFLCTILKVSEKEAKEQHTQLKGTIIESFGLNDKALVEVSLIFFTDFREEFKEKLLSYIVKGEEIKFFAILDKDESIKLICRNAEGRRICKENIDDYFFFLEHFTKS